ncbi:MAG: hypothetical protein POELPBGB_02544 [Bacteroidia bacterium]|nr:hypothetical protein [Bacteroidia bacterium]
MELNIKNSFFRDWDNIDNKGLNRAVELIVQQVKKANMPSDVHRMKKLKGYTNKYKIEIRVHTKIYWILCESLGNKVMFYRLKSEDWCKKNLKY